MHLEEAFDRQRQQRPSENRTEERSTVLLCVQTGDSAIAVPIAAAREVVEEAEVIPYPFKRESHLGIVNVRGTIVPVVHLGASEQARRVVILETGSGQSFGLLAYSVRREIVSDKGLRDRILGSDPVSGVIDIGDAPVRWGTIAWLERQLFNAETGDV